VGVLGLDLELRRNEDHRAPLGGYVRLSLRRSDQVDEASTSGCTLSAPASSSARASTVSVQPVSVMSSSSKTRRPSKAAGSGGVHRSETAARRCAELADPSPGLALPVMAKRAATGQPVNRESPSLRWADRTGRVADSVPTIAIGAVPSSSDQSA